MRCTKCGTESSRKFCAACGSPLSRRCPKCGAENAPSSAFCEDCGAELAGNAAAAATGPPQAASTVPEIRVTLEQPDASTATDGERKTVTTLQTVDRDVTGRPRQTYNMASMMRYGYERAAVLALIAVFVFVFADFRNLRDAILATVPLVFGGAWLLEAMGALGWEFNLANLFAVPIIIGMGVDMLYRWREERDKSSLILTKAVGKSVTICSLTTIAAFAALITASHRGISSLGWVLSLGVGFILLATFIVLPARCSNCWARGFRPTKRRPRTPPRNLPAASPAPACNRARRDSPGKLFSNPLSDDACDSSTPGFRR